MFLRLPLRLRLHTTKRFFSAPTFASPKQLQAININAVGETTIKQIVKQKFVDENDLSMRDLRVVDPSLPKQVNAVIVTRPKAILISLENIKVIAQPTEAFVFGPQLKGTEEFMIILNQHVQANNVMFSAYRIPFHLVVLESVLHVVCSSFFQQLQQLTPRLDATLKIMRDASSGMDVVEKQVNELLPLKNSMDDLRKRLKEVKRVVTEVLNSDETMTKMLMAKAGTTTTPSDAGTSSGNEPALKRRSLMSIETLLETYLNEIEWISTTIEKYIDEITNTEELLDLQLDILRNNILRMELRLSMGSFVVSFGALGGSVIGMNLLNHFETNPYAFYVVTTMMFGSSVVMFQLLKNYAKSKRLY